MTVLALELLGLGISLVTALCAYKAGLYKGRAMEARRAIPYLQRCWQDGVEDGYLLCQTHDDIERAEVNARIYRNRMERKNV